MKERIAIIDGIRTPQAKAGEQLRSVSADDLGAYALKELLARTEFPKENIDEVIIGNVAQPANAANISRVIALKSGFPNSISALTVHRNCASGMESITSAACKILAGQGNIIVAGGTESMSHIPLLYGKKMTAFFEKMMRAKTLKQKLSILSSFRLSFLKPIIGVVEGLTDPVCGLIMGLTAENLAREFKISREAQDDYALNSHLKALDAIKSGRLAEEIVPVPLQPKYDTVLKDDKGPREGQSMKALSKLRPFFDRKAGTVTVGNSCPLTDGAAMTLLMSESRAKEIGLTPMGYLKAFSYAGLEPERMGLGPVYATSKLLDNTGFTMKDFDLVELNEAFAAQVIGNECAFKSDAFSSKFLGKDKALGEIDPSILNVNGGAIALGHPVGTTGTRLVITILKELKRRNKQRGLATLCIGGGQGAALALEVD
ncbi:thiolase family protein [bacterium]|jgi:acetyl-CoA acyltransferase|nr:thiolase family protein [bacterium]